MAACVFCDIVDGRAPASVVHRDDRCIVFMDIQPVTPGHVLVVPLAHATSLSEMPPETGGALLAAAQRMAVAIRRSGLKADGINLFLADGKAAGQTVFHVHLHVLPRFPGDGFGLHFPPNYGRLPSRKELDAHANAIKSSLRP